MSHTPCLKLIVPGLALVLLAGCAARAPAEITTALFEQHRIDAGTGDSHTVLTGHFVETTVAAVAIVSRSSDGHGLVRLVTPKDGGWQPLIDRDLGADIKFVDVLEGPERDYLLVFSRGRIEWIDLASGARGRAAEVDVDVGSIDKNAIPRIDVTRDLNDDGLDDLIVPDPLGFWVSLQSSPRVFSTARRLGPPEPFLYAVAAGDERSYGEAGITTETAPWYLSRAHSADYDRDGRTDLIFWNQDHFDVHRQGPNGAFGIAPSTVSPDVAFDSDGTYSMVFGFADESTFALISGLRKKSRLTVLQSLGDVNGDGIADLMTQSVEGRSVLKQQNGYAIHLGQAEPDRTRFPPTADVVIEPSNRATAVGYATLLRADTDRTGRKVLGIAHVDTGVGQFSRLLFKRSIAMDLAFYEVRSASGSAPAIQTIEVRPGPIRKGDPGGPFFPPVLIGDINGDGLNDLLVGQNRDQLWVYPGVDGPTLFDASPLGVSVHLPRFEGNIWLADLDGNEKRDLVVYRPTAAAADRLSLLIAR